MNWNCAFTEERLSDYLEGALAAEEREACAAHLGQCAKCTELRAGVSALVGRMHALEPAHEPAFLAQRILRATAGHQARRHEPASVSAWFNLIWQPRFAMG
ncbi:MAG: zf-HC2 domain-containing protein, partial [Acidobacteriota bacterium]|nr:zf-HC2 domain-containing protein [Acidobacteriota bacterium]